MKNKTELELFTQYFNSSRSEVDDRNKDKITHADVCNFNYLKENDMLEQA